jgi:hypothetical protein
VAYQTGVLDRCVQLWQTRTGETEKTVAVGIKQELKDAGFNKTKFYAVVGHAERMEREQSGTIAPATYNAGLQHQIQTCKHQLLEATKELGDDATASAVRRRIKEISSTLSKVTTELAARRASTTLLGPAIWQTLDGKLERLTVALFHMMFLGITKNIHKFFLVVGMKKMNEWTLFDQLMQIAVQQFRVGNGTRGGNGTGTTTNQRTQLPEWSRFPEWKAKNNWNGSDWLMWSRVMPIVTGPVLDALISVSFCCFCFCLLSMLLAYRFQLIFILLFCSFCLFYSAAALFKSSTPRAHERHQRTHWMFAQRVSNHYVLSDHR